MKVLSRQMIFDAIKEYCITEEDARKAVEKIADLIKEKYSEKCSVCGEYLILSFKCVNECFSDNSDRIEW